MSKIIGAGGGGEDEAGGYSEEPDTLVSSTKARFVDLISEGEIVGLVRERYSIYLDGVPLISPTGESNFNKDGIRVSTTAGTPNQPSLDGFPGTEQETSVSLKLLFSAGRVVRSVPDSGAEAARVTLSVQGLTQQDEKGAISGSDVTFKIWARRTAGSWVLMHESAIRGKTTSKYQRSYEMNLAKLGTGPYEIGVERTKPDATSSLINDGLFWDSFTVLNYERFNYPNCALVGVELDSKFFSQVPERKYHVRGMIVQVPKNYDPVTRTYATTGPGTTNGAWDGTFKLAYTNNPAWCYYDLATNRRYGLGRRIVERTPNGLGGFTEFVRLSKWELYDIGRYCDQLVPSGNPPREMVTVSIPSRGTDGQPIIGAPVFRTEYEPRFTMNAVLNTREQAARVLGQLASVFWAMSYWTGNSIYLTQDKPTTASMLFTNANVEDGVFNYEGSSLDQRFTVAVVAWNDPAEDFRQKFEYVEDREGIKRFGVRQTELIAFGCTSRGQARRYGLRILYTSRLEREAITFKCGEDGAMVTPGEVVKIADRDYMGARWGGRIESATTTMVRLDADTPISAGTYTLNVISPTGTVMSRTVTVASNVTARNITMSPALPSVPVTGSVWVLESSTVVARLARIVGVKEVENGYEITATEHNPSKYAAVESGVGAENYNFSFISYKAVPQPTGLVATEASYIPATGLAFKTRLEISCDQIKDPTIRGYLFSVRGSDNTVLNLPEQSSAQVTVEDAQANVTYTISVRAVNALGIAGPEQSITKLVKGIDERFPPAESSFTVTAVGTNFEVTWSTPVYVEGGGHFRMDVFTSPTSNPALATLAGSTEGNRVLVPGQANQTLHFFVKRVAQNLRSQQTFTGPLAQTTGSIPGTSVTAQSNWLNGNITVVNGVLNGIGTANVQVDNNYTAQDTNVISDPNFAKTVSGQGGHFAAAGTWVIAAGSGENLTPGATVTANGQTNDLYLTRYISSEVNETWFIRARIAISTNFTNNGDLRLGFESRDRQLNNLNVWPQFVVNTATTGGVARNAWIWVEGQVTVNAGTTAFIRPFIAVQGAAVQGTVQVSQWYVGRVQQAATVGAPAGTPVAGTFPGGATAASLENNVAATLSQLGEISSDGKFTPVEKQSIRIEWDRLFAERANLRAQADNFSITTEKTGYDNALQTLGNYLNGGAGYSIGSTPPVWLTDAQLTVTTDIVGSTFRSNWSSFYQARQTLLNAIDTAASQRANWSNVSSRPSNLATLVGNEGIRNDLIGVVNGVLTGISTQGVQVDNRYSTFSFAQDGLWDFAGSALGWTFSNGTVTHGPVFTSYASTSADPIMEITGLSFSGAIYNRIRARIRRTAGTNWEGKVYYRSVANPATSEARTCVIPDTTALNTWVVVEWDMANQTTGSPDWVNNTITGIRIDFAQDAGNAFDIDWIAVGRIGPTQIRELGFTGDSDAQRNDRLSMSSDGRILNNGAPLSGQANLVDIPGLLTAQKIAAGAVTVGKLAVVPVSLCPDPYFQDEAFWTGPGTDNNRWYFQSSGEFGTPKYVALWSGHPTNAPGTARGHLWSNPVVAPPVGTRLRFKTLCRNFCNQNVHCQVRFYTSSGSTIANADIQLSFANGVGTQSGSTQGVVPSGAASMAFIIYNDGGTTFSGSAAFSGTMLDVAATGDMLVDGEIQARHLQVESVSASKIVVENRNSVLRDPGFYDPAVWGYTGDNNFLAYTSTGIQPVPRYLLISGGMGAARDYFGLWSEVEQNASYRVKLRIYIHPSTTGWFAPTIHIPAQAWYTPAPFTYRSDVDNSQYPVIDMANTTIPKDQWVEYSGIFTKSTAGQARIQARTRVFLTAGYVEFAWEVVRATGADLVVDGSITANKIIANGLSIKNAQGTTLLNASGNSTPPWVVSLSNAGSEGVALVETANAANNTASIRNIRGVNGITMSVANGVISIGGGIPTRSLRLNADFGFSSSALSSVAGFFLPLEANKTYRIRGALAARSAAATTGVVIGCETPAGTVVTFSAQAQTAVSTSQTRSGYSTNGGQVACTFTDHWAALSSAPGSFSASANSILTFDAIVQVGGTAGNFQVLAATEVNASQITLASGSTMSVEEVIDATTSPATSLVTPPAGMGSSYSSSDTQVGSAANAVTQIIVSNNGTWTVQRTNGAQVNGSWLATGSASAWDLWFEFTSMTNTGPNVSRSNGASSYTQITSSYACSISAFSPANSEQFVVGSTVVAIRFRNRSTGVVTTLQTVTISAEAWSSSLV